jgi:nucleoside-diphosphate-sugar epimerase
MKQVLVTGASGFVGREVACQLLERGADVVLLGRSQPDAPAPWVEADITDMARMERALAGRKFDCVMHLASLPGDTGDPQEMLRVNVGGCLNMLEVARAAGVSRFVLASSISAYEWYPGTKFRPPDYMPVDERHPCRPKDMYSVSKRMQEELALAYHHQYGVAATVLRLTACVGPRGKGGGRGWREFAEQLHKGQRVQIPHLSGDELCHYVDLRDVGRMFLVAGEHPRAAGEIFNCVGPAPTRGWEFVQMVRAIVPAIQVDFGFPWSMAQGGEISFSMAKAKELLDFEPPHGLQDSLNSIKEWIDAGGLEEPVVATKLSYAVVPEGTA